MVHRKSVFAMTPFLVKGIYNGGMRRVRLKMLLAISHGPFHGLKQIIPVYGFVIVYMRTFRLKKQHFLTLIIFFAGARVD